MSQERGLPTNPDAERFVLGSILIDDSFYIQAASMLGTGDFSLEKHRRIFLHMGELHDRGEKIDRITVANELSKFNELDMCDGLSYLVSLDDGLPQISNIDAYIRIVREKSDLRRIVTAGQQMMNRALLDTETAAKIIADTEAHLLRMGESQAGGVPVTAARIVERHEGGMNAFCDPSKREKGISTGFYKLDEYTGGLRRGDLFILAARPSMGKTAMALNIADHVGVKLTEPVVVFSLEMSSDDLLHRMICSRARVDSRRFKTGRLGKEERAKVNAALVEITDAPIYFDDNYDLTLMSMHAKLRRVQAEVAKSGKTLGLVIVDYLTLMTYEGRFDSRANQVGALLRGIKLMAKELQVPMLVLSQLSRKVEDRRGDHRPQLADLRESGDIEQDADLVGFIFREEVYLKEREDLRGVAELIIAKQRKGPIGTVNLVFLHQNTRFENMAEDIEEPAA